MMISGKTKVYGILANPVEHSLSPAMHNFWSKQTNKDMVYVPLKVEPGQVKEAVKGAWAMNLGGMNVTVPYKQQVMEHLSQIDEDASAIGAVNTLVHAETGYKGYNTDAKGLLRAIKEKNIEIQGKRWVLLGAGGAAKAAGYILMKEGAKQLFILNRSVEKGEALAKELKQIFGKGEVKAMALSQWRELPEGRYSCIQSTSVGMFPDKDHSPIEDSEFFKRIDKAIDIIYTPAETKFMRLVKEAGGAAYNGLDMLIYQGVIAYELWHPDIKLTMEQVKGAKALLTSMLEGKL